MPNGRCLNRTTEALAVYGPKAIDDQSTKDNSLYKLPPGRATPDGFDCDGIFVPSDRIAGQSIGADVGGPLAVKYVDVVPPFAIFMNGNTYRCPPNQGVFRGGEINWDIPNIAHNAVVNLREVPNHITI